MPAGLRHLWGNTLIEGHFQSRKAAGRGIDR
jgi:hypothetical protein